MLQTIRTYVGYGTLLCFIVSGILLNIAQLLAYAFIRPFNKNLFREINHLLNYSSWSQTVAVADWNSNLKCRAFYKDEQTFRDFGRKPAICIANHRYDIDWLATWMIAEKNGNLGANKVLLKAQLRYVPVVGWGWSLSDMIFLSRDWKKDRENLIKSMDILLTYPKSLILAFFEGTRFTKSKHEASMKFAEEKNLSIRLKHHLIPRTRGFNCMVERIKEGMKRDPNLNYTIFNVQIALEDDDNDRASLSSILGGTKSCLYLYLEQLDINEVSVESDEATSEYLFGVYKKKDDLHEYFKKHGRFPGIEKPYKPRLYSLLNWATWMLIVYSSLFYQYYKCFSSGSLLYITLLSTLTLTAIFSVRLLVNTTKVSKSSSYGAKADKGKTE